MSIEKRNSQKYYTVVVRNNSKQTGDVCMYLTFPDQKNSTNIYLVVWFSKSILPKTKVSFRGTTDYSFAWAETGELTSEMMFSASESKNADPSNSNKNYVLFSKEDNAYFFKDTMEQGQEGILTIKVDDTILNNRASVGIGVGGKIAILVNAFATRTYQFTPKPTYWVVFGNFKEGQVLDVNTMSHAKQIIFFRNAHKLSLRLTADSKWK